MKQDGRYLNEKFGFNISDTCSLESAKSNPPEFWNALCQLKVIWESHGIEYVDVCLLSCNVMWTYG